MKVKTGFRPEQRDEGWGVTHDKEMWRNAPSHILFASREQAEDWIAQHVRRLQRIADARWP